jgi:hypothetical protein
MAKEKLFIEHSFDDFVLFGVVSDVKEYRLAWQLNRMLDIRLVMQDDLVLEFTQNKSMTIVYYSYQEDYRVINLIKNLSVESEGAKNPYLVPELKNYQYLVKIEGEESENFDLDDFRSILASCQDIQYVNRIELDSLKSVDNLIF